MYNLFNDRLTVKRGSLRFTDYDYCINVLNKNLKTVLEYNRSNPTSVTSNHFLVKLIESVSVSSHLDVDIYMDRVEDVSDSLSMSLGMTSPLSSGKVFSPGVFYGHGSSEIIIYISEKISVNEVENNWENLQPCKFLMHPKSDLGLDVPKGEQNSLETGYSVITIDIPLLMSQYRMWRQRERKLNKDDQKTVMQFVSMFVLPNMLESQLKIALFNRLSNFLFNRPNGISGIKKPFFLINVDKRLDKNLKMMVSNYKNYNYNYDHVLEGIRIFGDETLRDVIKIPNMAFTRQVTWALTIVRIPIILFLLNLNGNDRNRINGTFNNNIRRSLENLLNNNSLISFLGRNEGNEISNIIRMEILEKL